MDAQLSDDGIDGALRVMYGHVPEWATFPLKDPSVIQLQASDTGGTWLVRPRSRFARSDSFYEGAADVMGLHGPNTGTDRYSGHMVRQMTATELKARILALLDEVAAGEQVEITKHGRTVARLVPAHGPHSLRGRFTGVAIAAVPDDDLFSTGVGWDFS